MNKNLNKKYVLILVFCLIIVVAFVVRFYNHENWLYFKMDQARDSFLISNAVENGSEELPLLGPRAGAVDLDGGFLRLGPAFYYFQYLSGVIFNSTSPDVFAYPDLFFSIAVLPLLYLFSRLYFKKYISLLIVVMYAFSFLIIQYSRFAWNPNSLPFFTILSFLGLLKFLNSKKTSKRVVWIMFWSVGLAIGSQLHFVGFFSLIGTSGLLIFYHYKLWRGKEIKKIFQKENIKKVLIYSGLALIVFSLIYIPVIASDIVREGENTKNFFMAISVKPTEQSLSQKFFENISQQIKHYTLITTAYIYPKKISLKESLPIIFSLAIFIFGIYLCVKKIWRKADQVRKDFLMLILLWFGVFFVICIPLAYQIRPRFFIFTFAIPFLFIGLIFEFLEEEKIKYSEYIIAGLTFIVLLSNIVGTKAWFDEQSDSQKNDVPIRRTRILKTKDGVTLGQLQRAVNYIYQNKKEGANVYFYVKPEHVRSIKYLFKEKNDPNFRYESMKINDDPNAQYFAIIPTGSEIFRVEKKFKEKVKIKSFEHFGQISVYEIDFTDRQISNEFRLKDDGGDSESSRVFWKDIF